MHMAASNRGVGKSVITEPVPTSPRDGEAQQSTPIRTSSIRAMQRRAFRSSRPLLPATSLAVAGLAVAGALTYTQVVHAPKNHLNQQSVTPNRHPRQIGRVGGFTAIQAALDATAPGGTLTFPQGGTYIVSTPLVVPPNITVDGNDSVLKTPANSTTLGSDDAIMQVSSGDTIRNFVFDGNVHSQSGVWTQHRHAISIGTASDISISYSTFRDLIGDGIYSSGASSLTIDHNQFSGDHSNRNGISVISGSNVTIYDNTFWSIARPDMPGAIDLEPNLPSQTLSDIRVYNNTINDPAHFGMLVWDSSHATVRNVTFENNTINGGPAAMGDGAGILIAYASATVSDNYVSNCPGYSGIRWYHASGGSATGNDFNGDEFGINRYHSPSVTILGNTYVNITGKNNESYP